MPCTERDPDVRADREHAEDPPRRQRRHEPRHVVVEPPVHHDPEHESSAAPTENAGESPAERGDHESRDQIEAVIALMNSHRDPQR